MLQGFAVEKEQQCLLSSPVWEQEVMSALCPLLKITMVSPAKRPKLWGPCVVRERGDKFGAALLLLMLLV